MLKIQSYTPTYTNNILKTGYNTNKHITSFKSEKLSKQSTALTIAEVIGAGTAGAALIMIGKGKAGKMSYEEALQKSGVEIKDGIAFLKATGEKFTGKIKRNIKINEKETVNFENGKISEKIYHNLFGRELEGEFYKDGELYVKVGRHVGIFQKSFPYYKYENGKRIAAGDVSSTTSVFKWARDAIKSNEKF